LSRALDSGAATAQRGDRRRRERHLLDDAALKEVRPMSPVHGPALVRSPFRLPASLFLLAVAALALGGCREAKASKLDEALKSEAPVGCNAHAGTASIGISCPEVSSLEPALAVMKAHCAEIIEIEPMSATVQVGSYSDQTWRQWEHKGNCLFECSLGCP
jgi:hypothetical protein